MPPDSTMPGRGGHPSGLGRGSLPAVKDQVIVPRGDSDSRCKERLDRFQLSVHGGGGHMTFHLYSLIQEAFMEGNSMQDWVVGSVGNGVASSLGGRGRKPGTKITGDK